MVHLGHSYDSFADLIGIDGHSSIASEYVGALAAVLFAIQYPALLNVMIHSDCLAIVHYMAMQSDLTWERSGLLRALSATLAQLKTVSFCHVKGHDWQPWNELCDVIAKATVNGRDAHMISNIFPAALLGNYLLQSWLWLSVCNSADSHAWPHYTSDGLIITKYDAACDELYPRTTHDHGDDISVLVNMRVCSANILTSDDKVSREHFVEDRVSRMAFLLGQAHASGLVAVGVQESTSAPGSSRLSTTSDTSRAATQGSTSAWNFGSLAPCPMPPLEARSSTSSKKTPP